MTRRRAGLGEKLRQLRLAKAFTQTAVSRRVGVSVPTISRWESNRDHPRAAHLVRLATLYGVSLTVLLEQAAVVEGDASVYGIYATEIKQYLERRFIETLVETAAIERALPKLKLEIDLWVTEIASATHRRQHHHQDQGA